MSLQIQILKKGSEPFLTVPFKIWVFSVFQPVIIFIKIVKCPLAEIITILLDELKIKYLKKGKKYAVENIKYKIKK